jgi:WD40 repeat protein
MLNAFDENLTLVNSFQGHSSYINRIKQSPFNPNYVATASFDNTVIIWDSNNNWTLIRNYTGHVGSVYGIEFINEDMVATGSNTIHIWYISTGITSRIISAGQYVFTLQMMCNGIHLAAGVASKDIEIYNIITGSLVTILQGHTGYVSNLALISSDLLASAGDDWTVRIWDLTTNTSKFNLSGHTNGVRGLKLVSSDILASGSIDKTVKLWNLTNGSLIRTLLHSNLISWSVDMLNSGILVSGSYNSINLWNVNTGVLQKKINTNINIRALTVLNANTTMSK